MSVPFSKYFLGGGPSLVPDLAGSEKTPAAPASFDVLDAFEQLGGLGTAVFFADGCYQRLSVAGDITPTAALSMAEHGEKAARDVYDLQVVLTGCEEERKRLGRTLQLRQWIYGNSQVSFQVFKLQSSNVQSALAQCLARCTGKLAGD
jgi:hypothetical protein